METVVHNIREMADSHRSAAEQLVGHELNDDQQIVIKVVNLDQEKSEIASTDDQYELPSWFNVYEGLSDEEIDALEQAISQRLDLTRSNS